ncbi:MAG: DUF2971 domain-containing protein [Bacteroidaceae bacterium]|nr:DUF2971 domain-containing protein [Bacteroidaceae bacterium]
MKRNEPPIFLWANTPVELNDSIIYHYTKAESLIKILENMSLRPSLFNRLNDLSEGKVNWLCYDFDTVSNQLSFEDDFIPNNCGLISFTSNYTKGIYGSGTIVSGANRPRMWAQYAENNYGACIAFRKDILLKKINQLVSKKKDDRFAVIEKVNYTYLTSNEVPPKRTDPITFIKDNYRKLFFNKDIDWNGEDEIRYLGINMPKEIPIEGAIQYICFGSKFFTPRDDGKDYGLQLVKLLNDPDSKCHGLFNDHSFSQIQCNANGYFEQIEVDWILNVIERLREDSEIANDLFRKMQQNYNKHQR